MLVYNTLYLAQIMGGSGGVESLNSSLLLMMDILLYMSIYYINIKSVGLKEENFISL